MNRIVDMLVNNIFDSKLSALDKAEQIEKIIKKLPSCSDDQILDIADNIYWRAKLFYNPTKEVIIPKEIYERIQKSNPVLLI